ncbi:MAG TPA: superinfection immunity protein [Pirellulales bacterium]|nr:superinfection immunity protein [Pirellulales bacterium]
MACPRCGATVSTIDDNYVAPLSPPAMYVRPMLASRRTTAQGLPWRWLLMPSIALIGATAIAVYYPEISRGLASVNVPGGVGLLMLYLFVYFLPSLIAASRNHPSSSGVFILNLFLGWTLLFWIIALAWSFSTPAKPESINIVINMVQENRR